MNTPIRTSLLALAMAGASQAASVSLVTNTNPGEVSTGQNDYVSEIYAGQTLYVAIPYAAGAWPSAEATDYLTISTFLLGTGGASTVSFSFYSATDSGTELSAITELSGFTAGTASISAAAAGTPAELGATAGVNAQIEYANLTGNPFASISNGVVWLGITNTGSNTVAYYTGSPFGGTPAPAYTFSGPFDTEASALLEDTYTYNANETLATANQNVHPYISITAETIPVPEPGPAALAGLAGVLLLLRRRV